MKNYQTVIVEDYKTGIWDNCDLTVEVNRKADKYRIEYDHVVWRNNSGSLKRTRYYLPGKDARKLVKGYCLAKRDPDACWPMDIFMR